MSIVRRIIDQAWTAYRASKTACPGCGRPDVAGQPCSEACAVDVQDRMAW